jgi:hypothetical protein
MELEHIEDQIETLQVIPDFGYETLFCKASSDEEGFKGWDMFRDFV